MGGRKSARENRCEVLAKARLRDRRGIGTREPGATAGNGANCGALGRRSVGDFAGENRRRGPRRTPGKAGRSRRVSFEPSGVSRVGRKRERRGRSRTHGRLALAHGRSLNSFARQQHPAGGLPARWREAVDVGEWNTQLRAKRRLIDRNRECAKKQRPQRESIRSWTRAQDFRAARWPKNLG